MEATEESFFALGVYTDKPAALEALRKRYLSLLSNAPWGGDAPSDIPGPKDDLEKNPYYFDEVMLFYGVFRKVVKGEIVDNKVYVLQKVTGNYSDKPEDIEVYATKEEAERGLPKKTKGEFSFGEEEVTEMTLDAPARGGTFDDDDDEDFEGFGGGEE